MIYDFTLLSGWEFSGVDVAQGFRARVFAKNNISSKFIFTTLPTRRDIKLYTGQGILTGQMMVSQLYMAGCQNLEATVTVEEILEQEKDVLDYDETVYVGEQIQLKKQGELVTEIQTNDCGYFMIVNYYTQNQVYMKNYYLNRLVCTEFSETTKKNGEETRLTKRIYWDNKGRTAFEELIEGEDRTYLFPDGEKVDSVGFMEKFIQKLNLTKEDTCILDRAGYMDFTQSLFRYKAQARVIAVLHSKQYYGKYEDDSALYLNYEYYYWFKYSRYIDTFVVGTEEQKQDLITELQKQDCFIPKIVAIPPGAIAQQVFPEGKRGKGGIITASRLQVRKRIELIIQSVAKAHEKNPEIFLDIYGTGNMEYIDSLHKLIRQLGAGRYIRLMGKQKLEKIYAKYEAYLTLSLWETFGLSLMEAVGSGLAMIGLDVKYGNHLFIHSGENGYLVDVDPKRDMEHPQELIDRMADKIVETFADEKRLELFHKKSYEIADQYMKATVEDKWFRLVSGIDENAIHIGFGLHDSDGNYSVWVGTAMQSIIENTDAKIVFHILHDESLNDANRQKLKVVAERSGHRLVFHSFVSDYFGELKEKIGRYTIGTMFRILLPDMLPNVSRIIYLDADLFVNRDINDLWNTDIEQYCLAAVPDAPTVKKTGTPYPVALAQVSRDKYFNAGVLYMNLDNIRKKGNLCELIMNYLRENPKAFLFDQDALNVVFADDCLLLDENWNYFVDEIRRVENAKLENMIYHYAATKLVLYFKNDVDKAYYHTILRTPWGEKEGEKQLSRSLTKMIDRIEQLELLVKKVTQNKNKIIFYGDSLSMKNVMKMLNVNPLNCEFYETIDENEIKTSKEWVYIVSAEADSNKGIEKLEKHGLKNGVDFLITQRLVDPFNGGFLF